MPRSIYEFSLRSVWQLATWHLDTVPVRSFIYSLITRNLDDVPSRHNDSLDSVVFIELVVL
jgi:hypothetical protein